MSATASARRFSVRSYVLAWITLPLCAILTIDTWFLYRSALHSVNVAYDRTLLATTHAVGDSVRFENGRYRLSMPLALFEIYETEQSGRYYYRVSDHDGGLLSGFGEDLRGVVRKRIAEAREAAEAAS